MIRDQVILTITPVAHIPRVMGKLSAIGEVIYEPEADWNIAAPYLGRATAIYTNPNKSRLFLDDKVFDIAPNLKVICTASTGTNHIDKVAARARGIKVLSIANEKKVIERISSTAEHALGLTLASIRHLVPSTASVLKGDWNYEPFIGRQLNNMTVGIIGFGRLGCMYARYMQPLAGSILVYDPYVDSYLDFVRPVNKLVDIATQSDIVSLHVHLSDETTGMISKTFFQQAKESLVLVNTARGEVVDECALVEFLNKNPKACIATDVLCDEIRGRQENILLRAQKTSNQILITPHIGGMTIDAQKIAFGHAADMLAGYLGNIKKQDVK